jgi:uncharacterized protein
MTNSSLRALSRKALAARAKKHQIAGCNAMTKDELVAALAAFLRRRRRNGNSTSRGSRALGSGSIQTVGRPIGNDAGGNGAGHGCGNGSAGARAGGSAQRAVGGGYLNGHRLLKSLASAAAPVAVRDALMAEAPDPCWIHVRWTLSRDTVLRAETAMGTQWHSAIPVLRVFVVGEDDTGAPAQTRLQDVEIHGDVDHWYIPVTNVRRTYKVQIGYRAPSGLFFSMARSSRVQTPRPDSYSLKIRSNGKHGPTNGGSAVSIDLEKTPSYDLRALPTSRLRAGQSSRVTPAGGDDVELPPPLPVELRLHAELIVHGTTDPQAELTLLGDRIPVSRDGTFSHRFSLPDGRQVIDAVVTTKNGCHQRTIVLGIERNTKELEPQWFDDINR